MKAYHRLQEHPALLQELLTTLADAVADGVGAAVAVAVAVDVVLAAGLESRVARGMVAWAAHAYCEIVLAAGPVAFANLSRLERMAVVSAAFVTLAMQE